MTYGKVYNKSTVREGKNYSSMHGEGSVHSNDLETARGLASGLADSVEHSNEIAYEAHKRWLND